MSDTQKIYGEFTQEELDWQYNNRERVPTSVDIMAEYAKRGEKFIASAPHTFDLPFGDTPARTHRCLSCIKWPTRMPPL